MGNSRRVKASEPARVTRRQTDKWRNKHGKFRSVVGVIERKNDLKCAMLNVDGLTFSSLVDIKKVLECKKPDVCVILETHLREEQIGLEARMDGYSVMEVRRSDTSGDRAGGGILCYTRQVDGLIFHEYKPVIAEPECHFVNKERFWIKTESASNKTAVCGAYFGCQTADDRHADWNMRMYETIHKEVAALRADGYRIIMLADFNAHLGNKENEGVVGNHPGVNKNGLRMLNFLYNSRMKHLNGQRHLAKGLWTRQRGSSKTIIDYGLVSEEHLHTVKSFIVDDKGVHGGGADHNWIFLAMTDNFVKQKRLMNGQVRKPKWLLEGVDDWTHFQECVRSTIENVQVDDFSVEDLAELISFSLLEAGKKAVGLKEPGVQMKSKPVKFPRHVLEEIELKRTLEREWKTAVSTGGENFTELEARFVDQKNKLDQLLGEFSNRNRGIVLQECSGNKPQARRCFWSRVSNKAKEPLDLSAVVDPDDGKLKCTREEIKEQVEKHYCRTFLGSLEPVVEVDTGQNIPQFRDVQSQEHSYSVSAKPRLPKVNDSQRLDEDPGGWINSDYTLVEIKRGLKLMSGGRAKGWDNIPNEFLINAPDELLAVIVVLFNKIKKSGKVPKGWNKGMITLIHKKGLRELLKNYRPITVIISISGLYSRVLNLRLTEVVENHKLLGEDQNGFRKGRRMSDNNFILDSILSKSKAKKKKVYLAYLDISKAYDSVNRSILWSKMAKMGFGGEFLQSLKAIYTGDCVQSTVNGVTTEPVFLRRGLRQGCSLSPILFALYISEIGESVSMSDHGFEIGGMLVSGLLFADDIVLVSVTKEGLVCLVNMVKGICGGLRLEISEEKSQVVSPEGPGEWEFSDDGVNVLSLKSVLSYKYLGTETTLLMSTTGSKKQKKCVTTAQRYKFACQYVAKTGPDVVDVVLATWSNIALPSILSGCEVIPFTEESIESIERIQSQLAKRTLGLPVSAPNVCAQTELGLKPFRMLLWRHQLSFYLRLLQMPSDRWASRVLVDHLSGDWESPYMNYITRLREKLGLIQMAPTEKYLKYHIESCAISVTNQKLADLKLQCVDPIKSFSRELYVNESSGSSLVAQFRLGSAGLGNRAPIDGVRRSRWCGLCGGELTDQHVVLECVELENFRKSHTGLSSFRNACRLLNKPNSKIYWLLLNGYDAVGNKERKGDFTQRGIWLKNLKKHWLQLIGY